MTCADYPWIEDEALAAEHFATAPENELFNDYCELWRRVERWRHRHSPTADRLEALADQLERVGNERFGVDWNIPF